MKGNGESVARCDAAFAPLSESVAHHIPQYDQRALRYGFRRAWEIRDEMARPAQDGEERLRALIAQWMLEAGSIARSTMDHQRKRGEADGLTRAAFELRAALEARPREESPK